jgi:hypothetical protein
MRRDQRKIGLDERCAELRQQCSVEIENSNTCFPRDVLLIEVCGEMGKHLCGGEHGLRDFRSIRG